MKQEEAKSLLTLAGFTVEKLWRLENRYWPEHENYDRIRYQNPWWLVKTDFGLIEIGWRKRVISISWEEIDFRGIITEDDVTKTETLVHAWSMPSALTYLTSLHLACSHQAALKEGEQDEV